MRLLVQRVKKGRIFSAKSEKIAEIGKGFLVLVGIGKGDGPEKADYLADKLLKLRIMQDENGKMNLNIKDAGGGILLVSQFTLYKDPNSGNRPSFFSAEEPKKAKKIYEYLVNKLKSENLSVESGRFGEYMKIKVILDGPVSIMLEK